MFEMVEKVDGKRSSFCRIIESSRDSCCDRGVSGASTNSDIVAAVSDLCMPGLFGAPRLGVNCTILPFRFGFLLILLFGPVNALGLAEDMVSARCCDDQVARVNDYFVGMPGRRHTTECAVCRLGTRRYAQSKREDAAVWIMTTLQDTCHPRLKLARADDVSQVLSHHATAEQAQVRGWPHCLCFIGLRRILST